ncbi:MAG: hypothetical protein JNL82_25340 [Myxococcales bacterium]|nr:hypothetical protein [Myxococcales bacterium]
MRLRGVAPLLALGLCTCDPWGSVFFDLANLAGAVACPELTGRESALRGKFSERPELNVKIAGYVQATRDLSDVAARLDLNIRRACAAIGRDLGVDDEAMQPHDGLGPTRAACEATRARIDAIVQATADLRFTAELEAPTCELDAGADAKCDARCKVRGRSDAGVDADCRASCEQSASLAARCSKPKLRLRASSEAAEVARLVASLEKHLPALIVAQVRLLTRAAASVGALAEIGADLKGRLDDAERHGAACISASGVALATVGLGVTSSIQASTRVSGSVGLGVGGD